MLTAQVKLVEQSFDQAVASLLCKREHILETCGDHPHGCFASGEIVSNLLIDVDGRPIVVAMFRKMTNPLGRNSYEVPVAARHLITSAIRGLYIAGK